MNIDVKIQQILKAHDLYYEFDTFKDGTCSIAIEWGDWKHDHRYLDHLMTKNGFEVINEELTNEDGSDCYSSVHYYRLQKKTKKKK